ncbi:MAG: type II secretion system protein [Bacteroidota bacterium]|nr:type II secretion system protein [Bacteroidota bacterium]
MNVRNNHGFTLIELISVLLIMGIVAAVVVSRVGTSDISGSAIGTEAL